MDCQLRMDGTARRTNVDGWVYVIQLSEPYSRNRVQFYVGWTEKDPYTRLESHRRGRGAKLLRAAVKAGVTLEIVWVERGTRARERTIKNARKNRKYVERMYRSIGLEFHSTKLVFAR